MDSTSPFTPKRSRIKRKTSGEINSVSRTLLFDDSHSRSPFNKNLEFSPLSQQAILPCENELIKPEQITPIKMEHSDFKKNNKILVSPSIKNRPNRFNIDEETKISIKSSSRKRNSSNNSTPSKKFKSIGSENCKPITYYFQPIQKITLPLTNKIDDYFKSATEQRSNEEKIKINIESTVKSEFLTNNVDFSKENHIKSPTTALSPHTQNRKKKNSKITDVKSQLSIEQVTKQLHFPSQVTPTKNGKINHIMNTPTKSPRIIDLLQNKVTITGGDTYSRFIKYIVLKAEIFFLCEDGIMTIIDSCTDDELKIFGRLIARKHGWIRADEPDGLKKYKELNLCHDFDSVLMSLATKQLINTDVYSCELDCLLNILKAHELKKLQKTFKINSASNKSQTKPEMIKSFMNLVNKQRTIRGNSSTNLKECIKKILGYCLKLSDSIRDDIMSCLIYESYPYFNGDEKDRFRDCFTKFSMVEKKELKFPTFNVKRVSINFNSKDSLEMYKNALNLRQEVQLSLEKKDHENAIKVLKVVFEKFKSAVHDKCIRDSFLELPTYLRKYSAVSVYAHVLFKNISILKKSTANKNLAKEVLEYLLKHKEFSMSKIPDLHIELAKVFESQFKQLNNAATVILDGLKDKTISELGHQMLSSRAMIYVNRKIRKLDDNLKEELLTFISNTKKQLPNTTINGKIISTTEKNSSGRKQVYSKKIKNGDVLYMSVEDLALSHYKSQGFSNGIHDEGQLIKSMFLLCFWDIIYDSYPSYILFISQYQDCPLDWRSRHFYNIREQRIKDRMAELKLMTVNQICDILKTGCDKYYETQSVINWKFMNDENLPICKIILECVGIEVFLAIGNQILKDGRVYMYGMPDLIVWDAINHRCMFVEVKGPNDKLSERQTSWLFKLMEFGANVEVCHVVGNGGKKKDNYENMD